MSEWSLDWIITKVDMTTGDTEVFRYYGTSEDVQEVLSDLAKAKANESYVVTSPEQGTLTRCTNQYTATVRNDDGDFGLHEVYTATPWTSVEHVVKGKDERYEV